MRSLSLALSHCTHTYSHTPCVEAAVGVLCWSNRTVLASLKCMDLDLHLLSCCCFMSLSVHLFISHPSLLLWVLVELIYWEKEELS